MSIFVKGIAIPNAIGYELGRANGDEGYIPILRKVCGEVKFTKQERICTNGAFQATANYWMRSDFIDVTDLADNEDGYCTKVNGDAYPDYLHIAFYTEKDKASSFVGGNFYGETTDHQTTLTAEAIKTIADGYGANYVVIASDTQYEGCEELLVTLTNEINFRLDDLGFEAGTHQLVVKAIGEGGEDLDGDGVIYADSDFGGDANGNPLEYTVVETLPTTIQTKTYSAVGYVLQSNGSLTGESSTWVHSDFIRVDALADGDDGYCVKTLIGHGTVAAIAFYSTKDDFGSYTEGYILSNTSAKTAQQSAENVKANITNETSKYVVFSTNAASATLEVTGYID